MRPSFLLCTLCSSSQPAKSSGANVRRVICSFCRSDLLSDKHHKRYYLFINVIPQFNTIALLNLDCQMRSAMTSSEDNTISMNALSIGSRLLTVESTCQIISRSLLLQCYLSHMASLDATYHLDGTLGALVIGGMVTAALYGVTTIQSYIYFHQAGKDSLIFKFVVGFLWILDTSHQVFICHAVYKYTVTDYGNVLALTTFTWSIIGTVFVTAIMDVIVRSIFCYRIWRFSKNWFVVALIMICSLGEFGSMMAFAIGDQIGLHTNFPAEHSFSSDFYFGVVISIVSDTLIAISQVILLWKRRTRIPRTNTVIRTLMAYSINTGLVTSICALILGVTWATMPGNLIYDAFFAALPTLLFNALLATLNARQELRDMAKGNFNLISIPLSAVAPTSSTMSTHVGHLQEGPDSDSIIHISKEIKIEQTEQIV
ncbi:hypothetical protein OBBRIDRAFT_451171 [Obba rivulosa]|uniref:DUF6534 domain-containing protein n=1 Tax=Obba rivulosa TaxID=1052685 RepID=A0A8E2DMP6_9APHY|nr:hypothetical protein OBBRIDRAFT_451171 [Obba rivulosa]